MLRNYLKIAWRNLWADRKFSVINILGLAIGLAITLLLFLFVTHERSFDTMYAKKEQIHRVLLQTEDEGVQETWPNCPAALAPALVQDIPEISTVSRMFRHDFGATAFIQADNRQFTEPDLYWADAEFFDIFDISFKEGSAATALTKPNTVVLSQRSAERLFGQQSPMGKTILVDNASELEITGVYEDFPTNSSLDAGMIASFRSTNFYKRPSWGNASFETYILTNNGAERTAILPKIQSVLDKNVPKENQWFTFDLQPLEQVHLYSGGFDDSYSSRDGDIKEVQNLTLLALLILTIACINYMNLTTARSQKRTKDVGISKTLGASTRSLMLRFYTETALITGMAIVLGIGLTIIGIPFFNEITDRSMQAREIFTPTFIGLLLVVWGLTSIVAGSYPAMYLSRFSPKEVMQPSSKKGGMATLVRKGLVVAQFAASVMLIVSVVIIYQQMNFIQKQDLGFNPNQVIAIDAGVAVQNKTSHAVLNKFKENPFVSNASLAQGYPSKGVSGRSLRRNENDESGIKLKTNRSDHTVIDVLQLELIAGQPLPKIKQQGDTITNVILNTKAVAYLGLTPEEAIGTKINAQLGNNAYVRGVVNDFNYTSLRSSIGAYAFHDGRGERKNFLLLRFNGQNIASALDSFEADFKTMVPNSPFSFSFLDKSTEALYAAERRTAHIGLIFSILAIFVACLGLFGLAAFTAEQRDKEIGIRKVLGASVLGITKLLSVDFMKLVAIALIIAFPLAYYLMTNWLQEFAYRISIGWLPFIFTALCALTVALLTVSLQSIKAALRNPIGALKKE